MKSVPFDPSVFFGNDSIVRKIQEKYAALFQAGETVLDVGCGNGTFLTLLNERGVRGIGIDSFASCIQVCREKGLKVHQNDALTFLRKSKHAVDGIFCSHIIEHLIPETALELLQHAHRLLNSGGRIVILTPNVRDIEVMTERFWLDITHRRPYPRPLIEKMLLHSGFEIVQSGLDRDSKQRILSRNPGVLLNRIMKKIRWGEYWGKGDTFLVGRKPTASALERGGPQSSEKRRSRKR